MITVSVQKSQKPLSPSKNCGLNDKSLPGHDITGRTGLRRIIVITCKLCKLNTYNTKVTSYFVIFVLLLLVQGYNVNRPTICLLLSNEQNQ